MRLLILLVIIITGLSFLVQNLDPVTFKLWSWEFQSCSALIAALALASGIYLANIWHGITTISARRLFKAFSQKITEMEAEIAELKRLKNSQEPLKPQDEARS